MNYKTVNLSVSPYLMDDGRLQTLRQACVDVDNHNQQVYNTGKTGALEVAKLIAAIWGYGSPEYKYFAQRPVPAPKSQRKEFEKLEARYVAYRENEATKERRNENRIEREARIRALHPEVEEAVVKLLAAGYKLGEDFHLNNAIDCAAELIVEAESEEAS